MLAKHRRKQIALLTRNNRGVGEISAEAMTRREELVKSAWRRAREQSKYRVTASK